MDKILAVLFLLFWLWGWLLIWPISKSHLRNTNKGFLFALICAVMFLSLDMAISNTTTHFNTMAGLFSMVTALPWISLVSIALGFVGSIVARVILKENSDNKDSAWACAFIYALVGVLTSFAVYILLMLVAVAIPAVITSVFH